MPITAEVIVEVLRREGIDRIFGIPGGGSTIDLINAASKVGIEPILCCHEGSASIIASVYGEIKDKPGVCFSIMGPGATNMASGIAYAFLEQVPLLAFTECHPAVNYEFITTQKINHKIFFAPITKNHFSITAAKAQEIIEKALICAMEEKPGPVHIDFPNDEAIKESSYKNREKRIKISFSQFIPEDKKIIQKVIDKINNAKRPTIIAGIEAKRRNAKEVLEVLAEKWNIPVMVTLKGRGVFNERHPLYGGIFLGTYSKDTFEDAIIGKSDLLIIVGVDGVELLPKQWILAQSVIYIGSQANKDAIYPTEIEIVGEIKTILEILAQNCLKGISWDREYIKKLREEIKEKLSYSKEELPLHKIIQITRSKLSFDGVLTTDVGAFNSMVHYLWEVYEPKTYFTSKGLSTMGFAFPAAIAAQIALPNKKVICFTGDGGFLMRIQELEMCTRLNLPIIIVIFSDGGLGLIKTKQKNKNYINVGVQLKNPDFSMIAKAFGGEGFRVKTEKEFDKALEEAINNRKLNIIEAVLNPDTYGDHINLIRG